MKMIGEKYIAGAVLRTEVLYCDNRYPERVSNYSLTVWRTGDRGVVFFSYPFTRSHEWSYLYLFEDEESLTSEEQEKQAQVLMDLINSSAQGE
jgi:hypothetical protein